MEKIKEVLNNFKEKLTGDDEQSEVVRFITVVVSISLFVFVIFIFTKYVINDGDINIVVFDSVEGQVNYNVSSVGTMLGKADEEYYVYIYSSEDIKITSYQVAAALYTAQDSEDLLPVYYIDLENALNQDFIATVENPENVEASSIDEISLGELTLIKIKNGKIVKYLNSLDDIEKELAVSE